MSKDIKVGEKKTKPAMHGAGKKITATVREKKPPSLVATARIKELETRAKDKVAAIVAKCKEDNSKFTDPEFRASDKSLWLNRKGPKQGNAIKVPAGWARVSDLYPQGVLFKENSKAGDVVQGELSDCWLIGGCSAVLTGGLNLKDLFVAYDVACGVYVVRFFIEGDWYMITIDDQIPVDENNKPVYGRNKGTDEFWVMILEKAFAAMYESYEGIHFGYEAHAMESLTGGVVSEIDLSGCSDEANQKKVFAILQDRVNNYGDAFAVAVKEKEEKDEKKSKNDVALKEVIRSDGLISGHAYGLLGLVDHKDVQLLHLRNPWGSDEWKGAWSTGSKEWTPDMKEACKETKEHDQGSFWISRQDFFANFGSVQGVRNFDSSYKCTATYACVKQDNKTEQDSSFAVLPEAKADVIFVLAQRDARYRSHGAHDEYAIEISFDLYKCDGKPEDVYEEEPKSELIYSAPFKAARSISYTLPLTPDDGYYVVPVVRVPAELKEKKKSLEIYLRCYSKCKVVLDEMNYKDDYDEEEDDEEEGEDDDDEEEESSCAKCKKKDAKIKELQKIIADQKKKIDSLSE